MPLPPRRDGDRYLLSDEVHCRKPSGKLVFRNSESLARTCSAEIRPEVQEDLANMGRGPWHSFSTSGLLLGTLFFAASLTPSLLPRSFLTQGVLSGFSLAAGYGIGVLGRRLWAYMELPQPKGPLLRVAKLAAATGCALVALI